MHRLPFEQQGRLFHDTLKNRTGGILMGAFLGSLLEYVLKAAVYAVIALAGVKAGKALRENKDAKASSAVRIHTGKR
jgi:hypothetical protein